MTMQEIKKEAEVFEKGYNSLTRLEKINYLILAAMTQAPEATSKKTSKTESK